MLLPHWAAMQCCLCMRIGLPLGSATALASLHNCLVPTLYSPCAVLFEHVRCASIAHRHLFLVAVGMLGCTVLLTDTQSCDRCALWVYEQP